MDEHDESGAARNTSERELREVVTMRLKPSTREELDGLAARWGISRGELVEFLLLRTWLGDAPARAEKE